MYIRGKHNYNYKEKRIARTQQLVEVGLKQIALISELSQNS